MQGLGEHGHRELSVVVADLELIEPGPQTLFESEQPIEVDNTSHVAEQLVSQLGDACSGVAVDLQGIELLGDRLNGSSTLAIHGAPPCTPFACADALAFATAVAFATADVAARACLISAARSCA